MKHVPFPSRQIGRLDIFLEWLSRPSTRGLLWALLALQVVAAIIISRPWLTADSLVYGSLAQGLRAGYYGTVSGDTVHPDVLRPPGLPLLLAAWPLGVGALIAMQGAIYMFCVWLTERALRLPVLPLAVFYPFPAFYIANVGTEAWAMLSATIAAWLVTRGGARNWFLAGLAAGTGALFRSDLLLLAPAIALYALVASRRHMLLPIIAAALVLTPYAAWNQHHFDRFQPTPVAGALGNSLWSASWQPFVSREDLDALYQGRFTPVAEASGMAADVRAINARIGAPLNVSPSNPAAYADPQQQIRSVKVAQDHALRNIAADPVAYAGHVARNIFALWNTGNYPAMPGAVRAALQIVSAVVWLLALIGVALGLADRRTWGPLIVLLYVPAIHIWLHTEARYTAAVRPLMLGFATLAIIALARRFVRPSPLARECPEPR